MSRIFYCKIGTFNRENRLFLKDHRIESYGELARRGGDARGRSITIILNGEINLRVK